MHNGNEFVVNQSLPFIDSKSLISLRQVSKGLFFSSTNALFDKIDDDLTLHNQLIKKVIYSKKHNNFPVNPDKLWLWLYNCAFILNYESIVNCLSLIAAKKNSVLTVEDEVLKKLIEHEEIQVINAIKTALNSVQIHVLVPYLKKWIMNLEGHPYTASLLQFILPSCNKDDRQFFLAVAQKFLPKGKQNTDEILPNTWALIKNIREYLSAADIQDLLRQVKESPSALLKTLTALAPGIKDYRVLQSVLRKIIELAKNPSKPGDLSWHGASEDERYARRQIRKGMTKVNTLRDEAFTALTVLMPFLKEKEITLIFKLIKKEPRNYNKLLPVFLPRLTADNRGILLKKIKEKLTDKSSESRLAAIKSLKYFIGYFDNEILKLLADTFISLLKKETNTVGEQTAILKCLEKFLFLLQKEHIYSILDTINKQLSEGKVSRAFATLKILSPLLNEKDLQRLLPEVKKELATDNFPMRKKALDGLLINFLPEAIHFLRDDKKFHLLSIILLNLNINETDVAYLLAEIVKDLDNENNEKVQKKGLDKLAILIPLSKKFDIQLIDIKPLETQTVKSLSSYHSHFYSELLEMQIRILDKLNIKKIEELLLPIKNALNQRKSQNFALNFFSKLAIPEKETIKARDITILLEELYNLNIANTVPKDDLDFLRKLLPYLDKKDKELFYKLERLLTITPEKHFLNLRILPILKAFLPALEKKELQKIVTLLMNLSRVYYYSDLDYAPFHMLNLNISAEQLSIFIELFLHPHSIKKDYSGTVFYFANAGSIKSPAEWLPKINEEKHPFLKLLTGWVGQINPPRSDNYSFFTSGASKAGVENINAYKI